MIYMYFLALEYTGTPDSMPCWSHYASNDEYFVVIINIPYHLSILNYSIIVNGYLCVCIHESHDIHWPT